MSWRGSAIYEVHRASVACIVPARGGRVFAICSLSKDFVIALETNYKSFWYEAYQGETYYVSGATNVNETLRDMKDFFDLYLKGIPTTALIM